MMQLLLKILTVIELISQWWERWQAGRISSKAKASMKQMEAARKTGNDAKVALLERRLDHYEKVLNTLLDDLHALRRMRSKNGGDAGESDT